MADRPPAEHGTVRRRRQGCDCPACRAAAAAYQRERYQARKGRPSQGTNAGMECTAEAVAARRAQVAALDRQGLSAAAIAVQTGLTARTVVRYRAELRRQG